MAMHRLHITTGQLGYAGKSRVQVACRGCEWQVSQGIAKHASQCLATDRLCFPQAHMTSQQIQGTCGMLECPWPFSPLCAKQASRMATDRLHLAKGHLTSKPTQSKCGRLAMTHGPLPFGAPNDRNDASPQTGGIHSQGAAIPHRPI